MADYACIIQAGQAPDRSRAALEAGLRRLGEQAFGDDPDAVEIAWTVIEPGFAWTAGEPSQSSVVIRSVPAGLPDAEREDFLRSVCRLWETETGCSADEIVVTAWDGPLPV